MARKQARGVERLSFGYKRGDLVANSQSEAFRYSELRRQYELCQRRGFFSLADFHYPFGAYYPFSNLFDAYLDALRDQ